MPAACPIPIPRKATRQYRQPFARCSLKNPDFTDIPSSSNRTVVCSELQDVLKNLPDVMCQQPEENQSQHYCPKHKVLCQFWRIDFFLVHLWAGNH